MASGTDGDAADDEASPDGEEIVDDGSFDDQRDGTDSHETDTGEADDPTAGAADPPDAADDSGEAGTGRFSGLLNRADQTVETEGTITDLADRVDEAEARATPAESEPPESSTPDPANQDHQTAVSMDDLEHASDVLLKDHGERFSDRIVCPWMLATGGNVLLVSLRTSADSRLDRFYAQQKEEPENLALITGSDSVRSSTTSRSHSAAETDPSIDVVADPGDLTKLGISISKRLDDWQENGYETVVCFHSLSTLLQFAELQRVFRFIHVLQGRLDEMKATTHYHIDADAHAPQAYATLRPLFDEVIEVTEDGLHLE